MNDEIAESNQQGPTFSQIVCFNHVLSKKFFFVWLLNLIYPQVIGYKMFDVLHLLFLQ